MENNYNHFDQSIKAALEKLNVPFQPENWDALSERLDAEEGAADQQFDAAIAQQLTGLEQTAPADWDRFSEILDLAEEEELEEVDQLVYSNLYTLEAPYNPSHWALMKEHLEAVFALRMFVLRSKAIETSLMFLLLFTFVQHFSLEQTTKQPAIDRPIAGQEAVQPSEAGTVGSEANLLTSEAQAQAAVSAENGAPTNADVATAMSGDALKQLSMVAPSPSTPIAKQTTSIANRNLDRLHNKTIDALSLPTPRLSIDETSTLPTTATGNLVDAAPRLKAVEAFEQRTVQPLNRNTALVSSSLKPLASRGLRASMMAGVDYHRVWSPYDPAFNTGPYTVDSLGFNYGMGLSYRVGRWEFGVGANYSTRTYRPLVPTQQYGTFDYIIIETFDQIHLEELEIPLTVQMNLLPNHTKWSLYPVAGISGNLVLKSVYRVSQAERLSPKLAAQAPTPPREEKEAAEERSRLNDKDFTPGFLEGGNLPDNTYLSYLFGLGIERQLDSRWSLYVQPTYKEQFRMDPGFGPNHDRFRSFSLRFGTRVNIW